MTGDFGRPYAASKLSGVGRKKDLIIQGGHDIHSAKIEELAMPHRNMVKTSAFADERLGERVWLHVIAAPRGGIEGDDRLFRRVASCTSRYDMPEYFLESNASRLPRAVWSSRDGSSSWRRVSCCPRRLVS